MKDTLLNLLRMLLLKLKERTTYAGLLMLVSAIGVTLSPELAEKIMNTVMYVASAILIWMKEKKD